MSMSRWQRHTIRTLTSPAALVVLIGAAVALVIGGCAAVIALVVRGLYLRARHSTVGEQIAYAWMTEPARAEADRCERRTTEMRRAHVIARTIGQ